MGIRISTMRKSRNMTQTDLADKMGVSRSAIAMWERNEREPNLETIEALADIFNVPMSVLIGRGSSAEDDDMWELREELRRRPEMRVLFSATKKATKEDLLTAIKIIEALQKESEYDDM